MAQTATPALLLTIFWLVAISPLSSHASEISGKLWNDLDRNGLQDFGEPGIPDIDVYLSTFGFFASFSTNTTDASGNYIFTGMTNSNYFVWIFPPDKYAFTNPDVGEDDEVDNDIVNYVSAPLPYSGTPITNLDIGLYQLVPAIQMSTLANGVPDSTPLYITNGAVVEFTHTIFNSGETYLSSTFIYNPLFENFVDLATCPSFIVPGETLVFSTQLVVTASYTNYATVIAFSVTFISCDDIEGLDPLDVPSYSAIIVVTNDPVDFIDGDDLPNWWEMQYGLDPLNSNAPETNSDGDWMTDLEEYIADTNPTNEWSYLPNAMLSNQLMVATDTSTGRVYSSWWSTNLHETPQIWTLNPPEQTGTGSVLWFTITNALPANTFRTGVRLP